MGQLNEQILAKAIYEAMDITDSLDTTSADKYARAAIVAIANAGFIIAPQDPTREQVIAASEATPGDLADMYRAMVGQYALEIKF